MAVQCTGRSLPKKLLIIADNLLICHCYVLFVICHVFVVQFGLHNTLVLTNLSTGIKIFKFELIFSVTMETFSQILTSS